MHFRISLFIGVMIVALLVVGYSGLMPTNAAQQIGATMCTDLIAQAEATTQSSCDNPGRNTACYGNHTVSVGFKPDTSEVFNASGDTVDLFTIQQLTTAPLDPVTQDWGIAILKAQANLPDALPGQNVTFVVYGDTSVGNPQPDLQAVTVSTRIGAPVCADAPTSAVLIQSPTGMQVTMRLNGADLTLASTAYVTAAANDDMTISIIEGTGIITAFDVSEVIPPGAQVRLRLGGQDGLEVVGPPSPLEPFYYAGINAAPLILLDRPVKVPQPYNTVPTPKPTLTTPPCVPRSDWTYTYTIPQGDTLSGIAQRIGMSTATLAQGNCIADPNVVYAGQVIRTPRPVPPPVFPPTASLTADPALIHPGQCSRLSWKTTHAVSVTLNGDEVKKNSSREVCPETTTTYTLAVTGTNMSTAASATVTVADTCGDEVCDPWENSDTCSSDCGGTPEPPID